MKINLDVLTEVNAPGLPDHDLVEKWVAAALDGYPEDEVDLSLRIVDEAEITVLNREFRGKDGPTNVLSFPAETMPGVDHKILGDIAVCAPVVQEEAVLQHKQAEAHWAHMVVHGVLHLSGFDHINDNDAEKMESRETAILTQLGYPDPWMDA